MRESAPLSVIVIAKVILMYFYYAIDRIPLLLVVLQLFYSILSTGLGWVGLDWIRLGWWVGGWVYWLVGWLVGGGGFGGRSEEVGGAAIVFIVFVSGWSVCVSVCDQFVLI